MFFLRLSILSFGAFRLHPETEVHLHKAYRARLDDSIASHLMSIGTRSKTKICSRFLSP